MGKESTSLFAKKTLAAALCNLATPAENAAALSIAGALGALVAEQAVDPRVVRQRVRVSVARLALLADDLLRDDGSEARALRAALPPSELALIASLADTERAAVAANPRWHGVQATLIESGVLLYLHTAGGGAAWGLFESLRNAEPRAVLVQNVARTALVTCFVPILMVGGVVTAYTRINRATDLADEKFALYFTACLALYPAHRLLTLVEKFAPLWLGGHIVGFGSFFAWTLYSESDLLKSDAALLAPPPEKRKLVVLWEANKDKPQSSAAVPPSHGPLPKPQ